MTLLELEIFSLKFEVYLFYLGAWQQISMSQAVLSPANLYSIVILCSAVI